MIAAHELTKHYGARRALDAVSFTATDGSITGLLGPNGAGKTTTFRIISGLLRPDAGRIEIGGRDGDGLATLGVLPHVHGLYGRLTVREHIRYFGALRGLRGGRLDSRVGELVEQLGLNAAAESPTRTLSEGQRVKVAVAGALVHSPHNLILDEPTSGLDVMSTRALHALLRSLRDQGACVLFSSHVMHEVSALCDEVVMMASGRVAAAGPPAALLEQRGVASLEDLFVSLSQTSSEQSVLI
jgi:sodium transport system ATP-binding protein